MPKHDDPLYVRLGRPHARRTLQEHNSDVRKQQKEDVAFTYAKIKAGPDVTEGLLAISGDQAADYAQLHERHITDALGAPELRACVYRLFDGPDWRAKKALFELEHSPRKAHQRSYALLRDYYDGATQGALALHGGVNGGQISQARVSQIIAGGVAWLHDRVEALRLDPHPWHTAGDVLCLIVTTPAAVRGSDAPRGMLSISIGGAIASGMTTQSTPIARC